MLELLAEICVYALLGLGKTQGTYCQMARVTVRGMELRGTPGDNREVLRF